VLQARRERDRTSTESGNSMFAIAHRVSGCAAGRYPGIRPGPWRPGPRIAPSPREEPVSGSISRDRRPWRSHETQPARAAPGV